MEVIPMEMRYTKSNNAQKMVFHGKDRSSDFALLLKQVKVPSNKKIQLGTGNRVKTEFYAHVCGIGKTLSQLQQDICILNRLSKQKVIFGDELQQNPEKITQHIEQKLKEVSTELLGLESNVGKLDNETANGSFPTSELHSKIVLHCLQLRVKDISKSFHESLELRIQNLKSKQEWDNFYVATVEQRHTSIQSNQVMLLMPEQHPLNMAQERASLIKGIERKLIEIQKLFSQIAMLVNEHDGFIQRIDDNIESASASVISARDQIVIHDAKHTSKRLMWKVVATVVAFAVMFILLF